MAAAVLGLAVPGLRVADAQTVAKTFPEFTDVWTDMLGQGSRNAREPAPATHGSTRTTSGSVPAAVPGRAPGGAPRTPVPWRAS